MALYKQWELLSKCAQESSQVQSPRTVAPLKEHTSSNKKKSKNSSEKKNITNQVSSEITAKGKKQEISIVKPIYPEMPEKVPLEDRQVQSSPKNEDPELITLTGAQMKCLIRDFAKQSIKEQLSKVLTQLNGQDED